MSNTPAPPSDAPRAPIPHRVAFVAIAAANFTVIHWGQAYYRPYVIANGIQDYGLAGSLPSLLAPSVAIFAYLALLGRPFVWPFVQPMLIGITIGGAVYEVLQIVLPFGSFDVRDLVAALLGGLLAAAIYGLLSLVFRFEVENGEQGC